MGFLDCIKRYWTAQHWIQRAEELHELGKEKPNSWDCDIRRDLLREEMKAAGLEVGRDYVVVYGKHNNVRHTYLELYGKNCKDKDGKPMFKLNGYKIDPAAPDIKLDELWKGAYKKIPIIIACLLLTGCASVGRMYIHDPENLYADADGLVMIMQGTVKGGTQIAVETPTGHKMTIGGGANWWQKNVVPMVSGVLNKAETSIGVK